MLKKSLQWLAALVSACLFMQCGASKSTTSRDEDRLLDKLTLFVEAVQSDQWNTALELLSTKEKAKILGQDNKLSDVTKARLKAVRLSTAAHQGRVFIVKNHLEGISDILPGGMNSQLPESRQEVPSFQ